VQENVLVVPTSGITPFLTGVFTASNLDRALTYILGHHSFRSRNTVEEDPSFKQIIPYVVVRHEDRFLLTRRTNRQTEARLHGKYSIGVGGHINDTEKFAPGQNVVEAGLERELDEEIHLLGRRRSLALRGIISDDSTPVGQVHLGLVFLLETDSPDFKVNEPDLMTAEWASIGALQEAFPKMETWSQIAFKEVVARAPEHAAGEVALGKA
jgi:predicted NUDIX family phosphoesterase